MSAAIAPEATGAEFDDAERVYKLIRSGKLEAREMSPRQFGLLYLYFPEVLPDVDEGVRP